AAWSPTHPPDPSSSPTACARLPPEGPRRKTKEHANGGKRRGSPRESVIEVSPGGRPPPQRQEDPHPKSHRPDRHLTSVESDPALPPLTLSRRGGARAPVRSSLPVRPRPIT